MWLTGNEKRSDLPALCVERVSRISQPMNVGRRERKNFLTLGEVDGSQEMKRTTSSRSTHDKWSIVSVLNLIG